MAPGPRREIVPADHLSGHLFVFEKPAHPQRQVDAIEQSGTHGLGQFGFMSALTLFDLIEPALAGLFHTRLFTAFQPVEQFAIDLGRSLDAAPEQRQLIILRGDRRADVGNQVTGVDAGVDEVQRAAHFVRFAVVERPEGAVGTAIFRREPAMQVDHAEPSGFEQRTADQRGAKNQDQVRFETVGQLDHLGVIDMGHFDAQIFTVEPNRLIAEENLASGFPPVALAVAQPAADFLPEHAGFEPLLYFFQAQVAAVLLHDGQHL